MKRFLAARLLLGARSSAAADHYLHRPDTATPTAQVYYDCVVVGAFKYPAGDASSNRVLSLAKTLSVAGRTPLVINDAFANPHVHSTVDSAGRYHGIDYICMAQGGQSRVGRLFHRFTRPARLLWALRALGPSGTRISCISLASGLYSPGVHFALHFLARKKTISDIVERHDSGQFPHGRLDVRFWRHRWTSWVSGRLADRVVVVSSALELQYSGRRPVLVLPPAVDTAEYSPRVPRHKASDRISLLYIGTPSRKDLLGVMLEAVHELDAAERMRIRLVIAGPSRGDLMANADVNGCLIAELGEIVDIVGPVSRSRVYELLAAADFTFLFRPPGGYADFGFPSKIPESLAAGCPVIVNLTSDLGRFLHCGHDSIICGGTGVAEVLQSLRRALELGTAELLHMSAAARATATRYFDYHAWADPLDKLLRSDKR